MRENKKVKKFITENLLDSHFDSDSKMTQFIIFVISEFEFLMSDFF